MLPHSSLIMEICPTLITIAYCAILNHSSPHSFTFRLTLGSIHTMSVTLHTNLGDLKIELECALVPKLCYNFLALAGSGQYDNTKFHRNMKGFMVQGGDPTNTGKGGESIWGGKFEDSKYSTCQETLKVNEGYLAFHGDLKHNKRGVVSYANRGPNTNGAQFFITYAAQPHLDNVYSVFGTVLSGWEILDAMEKVPVGKKNRPTQDIVIKSVTVHANPFAEETIKL